MARPTRPSDRVRDLVLLARTRPPRAAGHRPPRRSVCRHRFRSPVRGERSPGATRRTGDPAESHFRGCGNDARPPAATETAGPEIDPGLQTLVRSRLRGLRTHRPPCTPSAGGRARAARRPDRARGGGLCAGAAVRAAVGERADRQLARDPGRPEPTLLNLTAYRPLGSTPPSPARPPGRPRRPPRASCWPPPNRNGPWPVTRAWWSPPGTAVVQVRAFGRTLVDDPLDGDCTYTISGTSRGGRSTGRHPGPARPRGARPGGAGRPRRRRAHRLPRRRRADPGHRAPAAERRPAHDVATAVDPGAFASPSPSTTSSPAARLR